MALGDQLFPFLSIDYAITGIQELVQVTIARVAQP